MIAKKFNRGCGRTSQASAGKKESLRTRLGVWLFWEQLVLGTNVKNEILISRDDRHVAEIELSNSLGHYNLWM